MHVNPEQVNVVVQEKLGVRLEVEMEVETLEVVLGLWELWE